MIKLIVAIIVFSFSTSHGFAARVKVTIKTSEDDEWTKQEIEFVQKAADTTFERIASSNVANCAYRHSFRDKYSKAELRKKWGSQIPVINKNRNVTITVHKQKLPQKVLAQARVGIATINRDKYVIDNLIISVNQETVAQNVSQYSKDTNSNEYVNKWVNTIAHELAHNFGYSHKSGGSWEENYPGFFATELAYCVVSNGKHGSDLGDRKQRKKWEKSLK